MAIKDAPLAIGGIHRDFEADVLQELKRHKATMHGCPVWKVESKLDGGVAVWFKGMRDGIEWSGALRLNFPLLHEKKWLGDVTAVSETALALLEHVSLRENQKLIQRAVN